MPNIIIPTPLRKFTENQSKYSAHGNSVQDAVLDLVKTYPGLEPHILDNDRQVRSFIRLYVGEEDINELDGTDTVVTEGQTISIVPAIAGGVY